MASRVDVFGSLLNKILTAPPDGLWDSLYKACAEDAGRDSYFLDLAMLHMKLQEGLLREAADRLAAKSPPLGESLVRHYAETNDLAYQRLKLAEADVDMETLLSHVLPEPSSEPVNTPLRIRGVLSQETANMDANSKMVTAIDHALKAIVSGEPLEDDSLPCEPEPQLAMPSRRSTIRRPLVEPPPVFAEDSSDSDDDVLIL
ncbi:MAG: uncharacterized protein KVP18_001848 [Porospora cf. gigantea A]|uniref:uncharacterized protein n=2 Tax=Porospora cf. gigantea A TaxID=2853593 RepID=UPI0035597A70|nr:MAG: hypothetical protein KVP18_001848 [Porospora cf. gigantea A]